MNDSEADITELCKAVKFISGDIPIHFTGFFPTYKMQNIVPTPTSALIKAKSIANSIGIRHIYIGNTLMEGVSDNGKQCGELLIKRDGYNVTIQGKKGV